MRVIYRMCGIPSTNPSPIYQEDKYKLNELCLRSFTKAFSDITIQVHFLLDHCGVEYNSLFEDLPYEFDVEHTDLGINGTMLRSYELASEYDDYVLFQECDYLYRGVVGQSYLAALRQLAIVSPYDHPNFYRDKNLHSDDCSIRLIDGQHYRTTERNTMTWGCDASIIRVYRDIFDRHGYLDGQVWYDLKNEGIDLWVPIPSMATHMVKDYLAPGFDWEEIWSSIQ